MASMYDIDLDRIDDAVADIRAGKFVIVLDHPHREGEGDLMAAAARVTPEMINFLLNHARGAFVAVLTEADWAERMQLPLQVSPDRNTESQGTRFHLTCDAAAGTSGCSTADRALAVNILGGVVPAARAGNVAASDPRPAHPRDLVRPGHVVPISAHPEGLKARQGHTEAGVELARLAGFQPASMVDMEILAADGSMARPRYILELAHRFDIKVISIPQLVEHIAVSVGQSEVALPEPVVPHAG